MSHRRIRTIRRRRAARRTSVRSGFTLLEVVLASGILAIIGAAVSAVMLVAGRAVPSDSDGSGSAIDGAEVLAQMSLEASLAREILAAESFYVLFNGPDADGDGTEDEIAYAYSVDDGTLLRMVAGESAIWMTDVEHCEFTYIQGTEAVRGVETEVVRSIGVSLQAGGGPRLRAAFQCVALPEAP